MCFFPFFLSHFFVTARCHRRSYNNAGQRTIKAGIVMPIWQPSHHKVVAVKDYWTEMHFSHHILLQSQVFLTLIPPKKQND